MHSKHFHWYRPKVTKSYGAWLYASPTVSEIVCCSVATLPPAPPLHEYRNCIHYKRSFKQCIPMESGSLPFSTLHESSFPLSSYFLPLKLVLFIAVVWCKVISVDIVFQTMVQQKA